jgi:hypothetical protein
LDESTKKIITTIIESDTALIAQMARLEESYAMSHVIKDAQHGVVLATVIGSSDKIIQLHKRTQNEQLKHAEEALQLWKDMIGVLEEIRTLIKSSARANEESEQKRLQENTTKLTASWLAKQTVYANLMVMATVASTTMYMMWANWLRNYWSALEHQLTVILGLTLAKTPNLLGLNLALLPKALLKFKLCIR